jgi:hypothetical protein
MDESDALSVVALRAIETADGARTLWSDADRAWASRAAAEVIGEAGAPEAFLARRANLAIERLGKLYPALPRAVRALHWRPWVGTAVVALAFALGFIIDRIGGAHSINVLAPPMLALLVWNLAVYALVAASYVIRDGDAGPSGPLRRALARVAGGLTRPRGGGPIRPAIAAFAADWAQRSGPVYRVRAARVFHVAAATLAVGIIAGTYLRGLVLEYRATWESTFLDASVVRSILAVAYAPGALLTGIPVPTADDVAAIRAPASENAARWLHLMAATVAAVIVLPRFALALFAGIVERHRASHVPLPLEDPYFQRLLRGYRGGPARVRIVPYSYTLPPAATTGLEAIIARSFGGSAAMLLAPSIAYGDEEQVARQARSADGTSLVAVFNANTTPEREAHGAFLAALAQQRARGEALVALIDEGAFAARWVGEPGRIADRRAAWRQMCDEAQVPAVFVDLAAPDLAAAEVALDLVLGGQAQ